jgi:hypothetical protein
VTNNSLLPEVRAVLQRARSNRLMLEQLLDQVPEDRWDNRAEGDIWPARVHLAHLATIDTLTFELLLEPSTEGFRLDETMQSERTAMIASVADLPVGQLRRLMHDSRLRLQHHLAGFDHDWLSQAVVIATPGVHPPEQSLSLRAYLASWAEHDAEHAQAIRAAITASIQPGALSAAVRIRRRET